MRVQLHSAMAAAAMTTALAFVATATLAADKPAKDANARGRYLVQIGGCNDCHTPGYAMSGGKVPEKQWLTGDAVGWNGPWGTTYPINLRLYMQTLDEKAWVEKAKHLTARPPMPFWALNTMTDGDLRAIYRYVRSLGPAGRRRLRTCRPGRSRRDPS